MSQPLVWGEGPKNCKAAFVGESPGKDEARAGRPFVGRSGKELTGLMGEAGILRHECYITNFIKEQPPFYDGKYHLEKYIKIRNHQVTLSKEALWFREALKEELEKVTANVIVAVGGAAMWALTDKHMKSGFGIEAWRGSVLESTLLPGRKVIPIIHPAAALRNYIYTHHIRHDLKEKVRPHSEFPEIPPDPNIYHIFPTFEFVMDYLDKCMQSSLVAYDIETNPQYISFAYKEGEAMAVPFTRGGQDYFLAEQECAIWEKIAELMESDVACVAHNAAFDTEYLFDMYGIRVHNAHDTMVVAGINFPDFPKSLAFLTSIYTELPYYKEDGKEFFKSGVEGNVSEEQFAIYSARDSLVLQTIFRKQLEDLRDLDNFQGYEDQRRLIEPAVYMMSRGIQMSTKTLWKNSKNAEAQMTRILKEIEDLAGYEFNPNSTQQCAQYFYDLKKLKKRYKKGAKGPTTDDDSLKIWMLNKDPEIAKVAALCQEYRHYLVRDSRYYRVKLKHDRLICNLNVVGTETGRFSSSKSRITGLGANMQNQPPDMNEAMLPDHGYVGWEIDLAQAEARVVCNYGPDITMMNAFNSGKDLHKVTASMIFGVPYEEVTWDEDDPSHWVSLGTGRHAMRKWGKEANHALNYDMGPRTAALRWECTEQEARMIINAYHRLYPGVKKYQARIRDELNRNHGVLANLHGRKRLFMDRWGDTTWKSAYAFLPQSTVAAQINRYGLCYIYYNPSIFPEVETLMQIHDSIRGQIPLTVGWQRIAEILIKIKQSLETPLVAHGREFIIPADIKLRPFNFRYGPEFKGGTQWNENWNDPMMFGREMERSYEEMRMAA